MLQTFFIGSAVRSRVTGRKGYVVGVWTEHGHGDRFCFLHVDHTGSRVKHWIPEHELALLPPGDLPPFDVFSTTSDTPPPPGAPGPGVEAPGESA